MENGLIFERPIVFLDFETTGVDITKDRIIQIACIKVNLDGSREEKQMLIKPVDYLRNGLAVQVKISKEASEVHGILDEHLQDAPTFKQISKGFHKFLEGCDLGGYNSTRS